MIARLSAAGYRVQWFFLRPTAAVTAALLVVFTGALAISLARGSTAHGCGCLPSSGPLGSLPLVAWLAGGATISPFDMVRDLVFVALAAAIYWGDRHTLSLDGLLFGAAPDHGPDDEEAAPAQTPATSRAPVAGRSSQRPAARRARRPKAGNSFTFTVR